MHRAGNGSSSVLQLPFLIKKQSLGEARTYSICRNGISVKIAFEMLVVDFNLVIKILWQCIYVSVM